MSAIPAGEEELVPRISMKFVSLPHRLVVRHVLPITLITCIVLSSAGFEPAVEVWLLPLAVLFAIQVGAQIAVDVRPYGARARTVGVGISVEENHANRLSGPLRVIKPDRE